MPLSRITEPRANVQSLTPLGMCRIEAFGTATSGCVEPGDFILAKDDVAVSSLCSSPFFFIKGLPRNTFPKLPNNVGQGEFN